MTRRAARTVVPFLGLLVWSAMTAAVCHGAGGLTLDEYYAAALRRSEVVGTQVELIRQAEERYRQASATIKPAVSGVGSYTLQESAPTVNASLSPTRQPHARVTATQPLFRGFREFASMRQTKALVGAQTEDYFNARVQLFKDVVENFYNVLSIEQDLKNIEAQIKQNLERQKELNDRVRIGRSRVSEVLNVQTTVSTLRAEVEQLQGQLRTAREAFAFLSGLPALTSLNDSEALPARAQPIDEYLGKLEFRPDVKAAQQRLTAARENISVARGAYYPSVDLNGNYYLERTGNQRDVNWDVQIALNVPLYAGGSIQSGVREAASQRAQAELNLSEVNRRAEQEIRSLYQSVIFDRSQLDALEKATETARRNYDIQSREYRLGLVTNLDVLQALTAYQENQRALDRARYTAKLNYLRLQAAAVLRPASPEHTTP